MNREEMLIAVCAEYINDSLWYVNPNKLEEYARSEVLRVLESIENHYGHSEGEYRWSEIVEYINQLKQQYNGKE